MAAVPRGNWIYPRTHAALPGRFVVKNVVNAYVCYSSLHPPGCRNSRHGQTLQQIGTAGFEPTTSCTPSKRASQAAPRPASFVTRIGKIAERVVIAVKAGFCKGEAVRPSRFPSSHMKNRKTDFLG